MLLLPPHPQRWSTWEETEEGAARPSYPKWIGWEQRPRGHHLHPPAKALCSLRPGSEPRVGASVSFTFLLFSGKLSHGWVWRSL